MEQAETKSVEPHTRFALPDVNWTGAGQANPFVTTLEARLRCAQHNNDPNF